MTQPVVSPRIVVAGLAGESGKTIAALGLILAARKRGLPVRGFKKGPDYIDTAWLSWACGYPARNLDTYLMGFETAVASYARHSTPTGLNVIEGNRGLFDGLDARGTHSTAELAKALAAPVVLVVDATKVTRTAAAYVLGCQRLDPDLRICGVILNRISGERHQRIVRESIEGTCGIPVVGVLPRLHGDTLVPQRHLGLITPREHLPGAELDGQLQTLAAGLDLERLIAFAGSAPPLATSGQSTPGLPDGRGLKIGYLNDSAFTFYYAENLEALAAAGAQLVPVTALSATCLPPDLHALYIGGGFPETHGETLAGNRPFLEALRKSATAGLPVYAECGGLMLLSKAIRWKDRVFPMAGVLPFAVEVFDAPQGHGYTHLSVDSPNAFFPPGTALRGHEFHYSRILTGDDAPPTACAVERGTGCFSHRDGVAIGNVFATYTHLHALATPQWASGLLTAARQFAGRGKSANQNGDK